MEAVFEIPFQKDLMELCAIDELSSSLYTHLFERFYMGIDELDPIIPKFAPGQREVLNLVAQGLTNREIAERRGVSVTTVNKQVGTILERLGVDGRRQAAVRGRHLGLIPEESISSPPILTQRQYQVVDLLGIVPSREAAARRLGVTVTTLDSHLSKARAETGLSTGALVTAISRRKKTRN